MSAATIGRVPERGISVDAHYGADGRPMVTLSACGCNAQEVTVGYAIHQLQQFAGQREGRRTA